MKKSMGPNKKENIRFETNKHRPEIRDDIDSRKNLEQGRKGDHVTHNKRNDLHKPNKGK